jgi:hypothetical protein
MAGDDVQIQRNGRDDARTFSRREGAVAGDGGPTARLELSKAGGVAGSSVCRPS